MSSHLKRLTRKVFERHSNPWSAWTRLLSVPLVFVPLWTRSPRHAFIVGAWMLLNPVVFPKPEDDSAWATRAMLGEEMWIAQRPLDGARRVVGRARSGRDRHGRVPLGHRGRRGLGTHRRPNAGAPHGRRSRLLRRQGEAIHRASSASRRVRACPTWPHDGAGHAGVWSRPGVRGGTRRWA